MNRGVSELFGSGSAPPLVLVVDDEEIVRRLAVRFLGSRGIRVEEAADGASALTLFEQRQHDLILLDVMMPGGLDGFEVCERVRAMPGGATTPVLMVTSLSDTGSLERAYRCGATDFATKPLHWPMLEHRLRYMLRASRSDQALRHSNDELKRANMQLQQARTQLLQSEKMASIGQLAAGVAHEINNPIGYVKSNLSSLDAYVRQMLDLLAIYASAERYISDRSALEELAAAKLAADIDFLASDVPALVDESIEGVSRVSKIVQDLKDFSRVGAEDEWTWADLHHGLESTINIVNNEIRYKAQLVKEYGAIPEIECLPSQLNQVFMNMLVNAAHAIDTPGTIYVRSGTEDEEVWVEIADTGCGIPPEQVNRIFDPFFTTKPVGKGTGLGLALSYGIVQKHHGRIEVQSEIGRGTTFRIRLPVRQSAVTAMEMQS